MNIKKSQNSQGHEWGLVRVPDQDSLLRAGFQVKKIRAGVSSHWSTEMFFRSEKWDRYSWPFPFKSGRGAVWAGRSVGGAWAPGSGWVNMAETRLSARAQVRVTQRDEAFLSSSQEKQKSGMFLLGFLSALFYGLSSFLIVVVNKSVLSSYRWEQHISSLQHISGVILYTEDHLHTPAPLTHWRLHTKLETLIIIRDGSQVQLSHCS